MDERSDRLVAPVLARGFRVFFLLAVAYAVTGMGAWSVFLHGKGTVGYLGASPMLWHAHEMVFGYGMAVVAGFLLTAVQNWTGIPTWTGLRLAVLAGIWTVARILLLFGGTGLLALAFAADLLFQGLLMVAVAGPIIRVKQWRQLGVLAILLALLACNCAFYLGGLGGDSALMRQGTLSGVYLLIALIMLIGARVIPFFTSKRVDATYAPRKPARLYRLAAGLVLLYWLVDVILVRVMASAVVAGVLALVLMVILSGWYTGQVWRKPMLWVLHVSYGLIALGFGMQAAAGFAVVPPTLGLHTLAVGGIGLMTLGMMARVSMGHTGRNVDAPPRLVSAAFVILVGAAIVRGLGPMLVPKFHLQVLGLSQLLWMVAFTALLGVLAPWLTSVRLDGKPG